MPCFPGSPANKIPIVHQRRNQREASSFQGCGEVRASQERQLHCRSALILFFAFALLCHFFFPHLAEHGRTSAHPPLVLLRSAVFFILLAPLFLSLLSLYPREYTRGAARVCASAADTTKNEYLEEGGGRWSFPPALHNSVSVGNGKACVLSTRENLAENLPSERFLSRRSEDSTRRKNRRESTQISPLVGLCLYVPKPLYLFEISVPPFATTLSPYAQAAQIDSLHSPKICSFHYSGCAMCTASRRTPGLC